MDFSEGAQVYRAFTNGPVYRSCSEGEENAIDFSSFRQLHSHISSRNFSVKYVLNGTETYNLRTGSYHVDSGRYLLTNAFAAGEVIIDSDRYVNGVCMELSPALLAEVLAVFSDPNSPYPRKDFSDFLTTADFFEHCYDSSRTRIGRYLQRAIPGMSGNAGHDDLFLGQFFFGLAEQIIADQKELYGYFCSLSSVKTSTKKDLIGRLMKGKELMDDMYTEKISIAEIARTATMSEYYFLRLFKRVFGCSPYRYLLDKRLEKATYLLQHGQDFIASIGYKCGFSDVYTFSKAFKKKYGRNPSDERLSGKP